MYPAQKLIYVNLLKKDVPELLFSIKLKVIHNHKDFKDLLKWFGN